MTRRQEVVIFHDGETVWRGPIEEFASDLGVSVEASDLYMYASAVVFPGGATAKRTVSIETWDEKPAAVVESDT